MEVKKTWLVCGTALLCCVILCACALICADRIVKSIDRIYIPSSISVSDASSGEPDESDFLSLYEAAAYLNIDDTELQEMTTAGKLDGTFFTTDSGNYIFIREQLCQWAMERVNTP